MGTANTFINDFFSLYYNLSTNTDMIYIVMICSIRIADILHNEVNIKWNIESNKWLIN